MQTDFDTEKRTSLERADLSRKGAIDNAIVHLIEQINSLEACYTTSSCSGRISLYSQDPQNSKKGCRWILVSHVPLKSPEIWSLLIKPGLPSEGHVFFKFEPFIVHIMCKTLDTARGMLQVAVGSGFRNSGITVGKRDRIMLAVRSTHSLETPVAFNGKLIVDIDYVGHLVELANTKMAENFQRIERFTQQLRKPDCEVPRKVEKQKESGKQSKSMKSSCPSTEKNIAAEGKTDNSLFLSENILHDLFS